MGSKITSALELAQAIVHADPFYAGKLSLPLLFILDPPNLVKTSGTVGATEAEKFKQI